MNNEDLDLTDPLVAKILSMVFLVEGTDDEMPPQRTLPSVGTSTRSVFSFP